MYLKAHKLSKKNKKAEEERINIRHSAFALLNLNGVFAIADVFFASYSDDTPIWSHAFCGSATVSAAVWLFFWQISASYTPTHSAGLLPWQSGQSGRPSEGDELSSMYTYKHKAPMNFQTAILQVNWTAKSVGMGKDLYFLTRFVFRRFAQMVEDYVNSDAGRAVHLVCTVLNAIQNTGKTSNDNSS